MIGEIHMMKHKYNPKQYWKNKIGFDCNKMKRKSSTNIKHGKTMSKNPSQAATTIVYRNFTILLNQMRDHPIISWKYILILHCHLLLQSLQVG